MARRVVEGPVLTSVSRSLSDAICVRRCARITIHPPGIVFQKPYSTGNPDLAGFDNKTTPDRKLAQAAQSAQELRSRSGAARIKKACRRLSGGPTTRTTMTFRTTWIARREGDVGWNALGNVTNWLRVGHGDRSKRHISRQENRRVGRAVNASAARYRVSSRASRSNRRHRPRSSSAVPVSKAIEHSSPFDVKDDHSPILRVECSQDASGERLFQSMGSRIRNRSTTKWRLTGRWGHAGSLRRPMP